MIFKLSEATEWLIAANRELEKYITEADKQWEGYNDATSLDGKKLDPPPSDYHHQTLQDFVGKKWIRGHIEPAMAERDFGALLDLQARLIDGPLPPKNRKRANREILAMFMYMKMGLWLCYFCLGAVQQRLWQEVVSLGEALGAFPGEPFFNIMVGNVYRTERDRISRTQVTFPRERERPSRVGKEVEDSKNIDDEKAAARDQKMPYILSMSFTPVILIPDLSDLRTSLELRKIFPDLGNPSRLEERSYENRERIEQKLYPVTERFSYSKDDDKDEVPTTLKEVLERLQSLAPKEDMGLEEDKKSFYKQYITFIRRAEWLSYRYMRFEVWRYLNQTPNPAEHGQHYGIRYGASRPLASAALRNLAERLYAGQVQAPSDVTIDATVATETPLTATESLTTIVEKEAIVKELLRLSDKRLEVFLGKYDPVASQKRLVVFDNEPRGRRGISSCSLAPESGTTASQPSRAGQWNDSCYFVEGIELAAEREKIKKLWRSHNHYSDEQSRLKTEYRTSLDEAKATGEQPPSLEGLHEKLCGIAPPDPPEPDIDPKDQRVRGIEVGRVDFDPNKTGESAIYTPEFPNFSASWYSSK